MPKKTHQFPRIMNFPSIKYDSSIRWCPGNPCFLHQVLFPWHKLALFCTKFKLWKWILFTTMTKSAIWHNLKSFHSILHKFVVHSYFLCTKKDPTQNLAQFSLLQHSLSLQNIITGWVVFISCSNVEKLWTYSVFSAHRLTTWMDYKPSSSFEHLSPTVHFGTIWLNSTQFGTLCTVKHNID